MEKQFTFKYKGDVFSITRNTTLSPSDVEEFSNLLYNGLTKMHNSKEIRVIVLETWLIVEYYIRCGLEKAFNLNKFKTDDLDPKYDLLPSSFISCLEMLNRILKSQKNLPLAPKKEDITASPQLWGYITEHNPKLLKEIKQIVEEYNNFYYPQKETDICLSLQYFGPYQQEGLVNEYCNVDEKWIKKANKLNRTRNLAAHSYDEEKIYQSIGFSDEQRFEKAKNFCIGLLNDLCSFAICKSNDSVDIDMDL